MRILYIHGTFVAPPAKLEWDRFALLGEHLKGEVLHPSWFRTEKEFDDEYGPGNYPMRKVNGIRYHWVMYRRRGKRIERVLQLLFFVRKGLQLHREEPVDCIITYSYQMVGLVGVVLKYLTGAKLIVEIATSPEHVHLTNRPIPSLSDRLARLYSNVCLHVTLLASDRTRILAPDLLKAFRLLRDIRTSVFHDFVVASQVQENRDKPELRVLFVGAPWYLKGVDILIAAFQRLEKDFPTAKLQIMGHFTDRAGLEKLIGEDKQIEIIKAKLHPEALKTIAASSILVLPSRCEGMGRVLIEAMSAGVPVIGSEVGGIPHIVRHGVNGFLFPSEDVGALEEQLRKLLADPDLRERMGEMGRRMAKEAYSEERYVEEFVRMVTDTVRGN